MPYFLEEQEEDKKKIIALAYAIGEMNERIEENRKIIEQFKQEKKEIEEDFKIALRGINGFRNGVWYSFLR